MAKNPHLTLKDAIHKIQLSLLDGVSKENQLFAAGTLLSRSDYEDVVTERSISNLCGYPLCNNSLPSDPLHKGRYRISLKEHKVYDLTETGMFCSSSCLINSRAFAASLKNERCAVSDSRKILEVLRLFGNKNEDNEDLSVRKKNDLEFEFSNLSIQEKPRVKAAEMLLEDWIGPSNAIEGYIPQRDRGPSHLQYHQKGTENKQLKQNGEEHLIGDGVCFASTIIVGDPCNNQKTSSNKKSNSKQNVLKLKEEVSTQKKAETNTKELKSSQNYAGAMTLKDSVGKSTELIQTKSSLTSLGANILKESIEKTSEANGTQLKSSLKSTATKTLNRNVTWADEKKAKGRGGGKLCNFQDAEDNSGKLCNFHDAEDNSGQVGSSGISNEEDISCSLRRASADTCATALCQAAEAVASREIDFGDAVSEAGIIILPNIHDGVEGNSAKDVDPLEPEQGNVNWPKEPMFLDSAMFNSQSWHDTPPEGFSLTLSSFATMWMALFGWVSASSLAYIYGQDESSVDEFIFVSGREYPRKIVLSDGRSSEIKQTLGGCIARALPGLVTDLCIPTPISTLEQTMVRLVDTMSFIDALPPFRTKQWQVIVLLFIDALSVCRIPVLTPHMASKRALIHKVLDAAQISGEEYETMKNFLMPLGRLPEFSAQNGG